MRATRAGGPAQRPASAAPADGRDLERAERDADLAVGEWGGDRRRRDLLPRGARDQLGLEEVGLDGGRGGKARGQRRGRAAAVGFVQVDIALR